MFISIAAVESQDGDICVNYADRVDSIAVFVSVVLTDNADGMR